LFCITSWSLKKQPFHINPTTTAPYTNPQTLSHKNPPNNKDQYTFNKKPIIKFETLSKIEMAQLSRINNLAQITDFFHHSSNSRKPNSAKSVSLRSNLWASSKSWSLKHKNGVFIESCDMGRGNSFVLKASASVAAAEKPSTAPEIVLEPISEIAGTITLPGSKSLSNRILLLAALSEVKHFFI
jgi:hypothetical protein